MSQSQGLDGGNGQVLQCTTPDEILLCGQPVTFGPSHHSLLRNFLVWYFYPALQIASCGPQHVMSGACKLVWSPAHSSFWCLMCLAPGMMSRRTQMLTWWYIARHHKVYRICLLSIYSPQWCHAWPACHVAWPGHLSRSSPLITRDAIDSAWSKSRWNFFSRGECQAKYYSPLC